MILDFFFQKRYRLLCATQVHGYLFIIISITVFSLLCMNSGCILIVTIQSLPTVAVSHGVYTDFILFSCILENRIVSLTSKFDSKFQTHTVIFEAGIFTMHGLGNFFGQKRHSLLCVTRHKVSLCGPWIYIYNYRCYGILTDVYKQRLHPLL